MTKLNAILSELNKGDAEFDRAYADMKRYERIIPILRAVGAVITTIAIVFVSFWWVLG